MARVTFGVAASCFAANMAVKHNAIQHEQQFPLAAQAVKEAFYVDDGLTGADNTVEAIHLREELQQLFNKGHFTLRKWNSSDPTVLKSIPAELRDAQDVLCISEFEHNSATTLGVKWDAKSDVFHIQISKPPEQTRLTKRQLLSDISKVFDVLGWYAPSTILMKILLQETWESNVGWDDMVSDGIMETWQCWRSELDMVSNKSIPRCYHPKDRCIVKRELLGFCDASEKAYAGVIYLRSTDMEGHHHVTLVVAKTKVAPIRRISLPRLELCGAVILTRLVEQSREVLGIPLEDVHLWTDSTIVLAWLSCNPRRLKTYVANRVTEITDAIPPSRWRHVRSEDNPADCASRGLLPSQLMVHDLWWDGPPWVSLNHEEWPQRDSSNGEPDVTEEVIACVSTPRKSPESVLFLKNYSSYNRPVRVVAWIKRFVSNCSNPGGRVTSPHLTVEELGNAEVYVLKHAQMDDFQNELNLINSGNNLPKNSKLLPLHPYLGQRWIAAGKRQIGAFITSRFHEASDHIVSYTPCSEADHPS